MVGVDELMAVAERYGRFARLEAPGRSALYAEWAVGVAADDAVQEVLARIPAARRQPPLVFALTRLLGAPEGSFGEWRDWVLTHADALVSAAAVRALQTNEPLRCAALLPALATVPGPIALIELGASAGLCLLPDRYSYRYTRADASPLRLDPAAGVSAVVLESSVSGNPPVRMPEILFRAGIDLLPLDPADVGDRAFLRALVWPGERDRERRVGAALDLARAEGVRVEQADAGDPAVIDRLIRAVPDGVTAVVSTLGLMPHLPRRSREGLIGSIASAGGTWISLDPAGAHERWTREVDPGEGRFVLHRDGAPLAYADPLGASVEWLAG
ncbi:DUF2332 domain-containing protein [Microbacterium sp. KSW-48]|nr:DUF2332 domain-containing protein [Microbacterium sp. KSW-48]MDZ8171944.1 DUF2332 domain-containing protein [Microbacterium sp. KSW-48]